MAQVGNRALLILLLAALMLPGCSREKRLPARRADRLVRTAPDWGAQAEGVQCRLRPTKRLWLTGEALTFKLDLRNQGQRLFAFDVREPIRPSRIAVDGRWHHWRRDETSLAKIRPLGPGVEFADLTLTIPPEMDLPLGPGRHTIQVTLDFEDLTVISDPVRIEIAPRSSETGS